MTPTSRHQFFTTARQFAAALLLLAACVTPSAHAQEMVWTAAKLLLDGKETPELTGVGRRDRSADPLARITLKTGDKLPPGAEIAVPPRASVELLDANGNRTTLYPGSRIVLLHLSARGARQQMMEGRARFSISKALDYFNVNTPDRFLATVKGTDYELALAPGKSIEFKVAEGAVEVERTGTVRIAQDAQGQPREVENVAEAETLEAGQAKRYDLTQVQYLREFGNFKEAEGYFRKALQEAEKSGDKQRIQRARENLGWMLITLSVFQEAGKLFQQNLDAAKQDDNEVEQAYALHGLGVANRSLNEYRRAIEYYEQARAMWTRLFGERDHDGIADVYNNLGNAYGQPNEIPRAIEYYEQALAMRKRLFGEGDHDRIATLYNNLGVAYGKQHEFRRAIEFYEQALAMWKRLFGERDHDGIAGLYYNLGNAYGDLNEFRRAKELYKQALAMMKRLFGERDLGTIAQLSQNLGLAYFRLNEFRRASEYYEQALRMVQRLYGERDHDGIAALYNNLGVMYKFLSEYPRALEHYQQSLAMLKRLFGERDRYAIARAYSNIGEVYIALNDGRLALDYLERSLAMKKRLLGERDHDGFVGTLGHLATAHEKSGDAATAAKYRAEADAMAERLKQREKR